MTIRRFLLLTLVLGPAWFVHAPSRAEPFLSPRFDPGSHWRSDEIERGMKGYGLTVFEATRIERFDVEILGVLHNEWSDTDMIISRVSGGPLERTGVIAGMSGSPIYIDGKLVGALAYAWGFAKEPIAGITPIEAMLPVLDLPPTEREETATAGDARKISVPVLGGKVDSLLSPDEYTGRLLAFLAKDHSAVMEPPSPRGTFRMDGPAPPGPIPFSTAGGPFRSLQAPLEMPSLEGWIPLATPIMVGGYSGDLMDHAASLLSPMGFLPIPGGLTSAQKKPKLELEPGAAVGVAMIRGDLEMAGLGTVTYREGNQVLGFGHSMFMDGPTDLPLTNGYVHAILPSLSISSKMGGAIDIVGALVQDRLTAIGGTIGAKARTFPVRVRIRNQSAGFDRSFGYDLAYHRFYSPRFAFFCVMDALGVVARAFRDSTVEYTLEIDLEEHPPVILKDQVASSGGSAPALSMAVSDALDILMRNPYEKVRVRGVDLEVRVIDRLRIGTLEWIGVENQFVEPGDFLVLRLAIQNWLGELEILERSIRLPENLPPGPVQLAVTDARSHLTESVQRNPDRFRPRDLEDILGLLGEYYRNDDIFITLATLSPGVSYFGVEMPDLPTSVLRVMSQSPDRGTGMLVAARVLHEETVRMDRPVSGSQRIMLTVKPKKSERLY